MRALLIGKNKGPAGYRRAFGRNFRRGYLDAVTMASDLSTC